MSYRRAVFGFTLPIALALACAACGQNQGQQPIQNQPATGATAMTRPSQNPMSQSPMSQNPAAQSTAPNSMMAPMPGATAGANGMGGPGDFNTLAGAKGYITQSDAMQDHWMNTHFEQCDSDHDGKVTHTEYDACHNPNASMQPQSPQSGGQ